ncbi:MAG: cytochrome C oxidase subunit IV family protein [Methylocystis sp.]|uniref:cytochrome C oxidase subunit IV family protein n=1 Tax=Methylocystis sp. TaxID=1911079 RepID=UPI003DA48AD6
MKTAEGEVADLAPAGGRDAAAHGKEAPVREVHGQQHPIGLYLTVWVLLFVLSACSYLVDYFNLHGNLRWGLIVFFMMAKASLIVAVFMHMAWERLALVSAILIPPLAVLVFMASMAMEGDYTFSTRSVFFAPGAQTQISPHAP